MCFDAGSIFMAARVRCPARRVRSVRGMPFAGAAVLFALTLAYLETFSAWNAFALTSQLPSTKW
jgi:hypothetical protein